MSAAFIAFYFVWLKWSLNNDDSASPIPILDWDFLDLDWIGMDLGHKIGLGLVNKVDLCNKHQFTLQNFITLRWQSKPISHHVKGMEDKLFQFLIKKSLDNNLVKEAGLLDKIQ